MLGNFCAVLKCLIKAARNVTNTTPATPTKLSDPHATFLHMKTIVRDYVKCELCDNVTHAVACVTCGNIECNICLNAYGCGECVTNPDKPAPDSWVWEMSDTYARFRVIERI
jgi:hypothetical protein